MSDDMIEYDEKAHMSYDKEAGASLRSVRGSPDTVNGIIFRYCLGDFEYKFEVNMLKEKKYSKTQLLANPMSGMFQFSSSFRKEKKKIL